MSVYAALPRGKALMGARLEVHVTDVPIPEMFSVQRVVETPPKLQRSALSGVRPSSVGDVKTATTTTGDARAATGCGGARWWEETEDDES